MPPEFLVFEVHYGGRFSRHFGCSYVNGDVSMYNEPYDSNCLSFFELEDIVKPFGYKLGDLIYYKQPGKSLDNGAILVSSDHDVLAMGKCHEGESVVVLFLALFSENVEGDNVGEDVGEEERERCRLGLNDHFWDQVLCSNDELFVVEVDNVCNDGVGPSSARDNVLDIGRSEFWNLL
ncbi:hypothetical protein CJ030_MR2G000728 [Morella rubra]|uniref:PB1-like domain-containing protein n=1 Tax=Morella rubra TaxID=262757 RepID=A0A6A1WSA2_9ROSI|nr:hypothetical protein CJ030_MR2G000728 [Morella rubra]